MLPDTRVALRRRAWIETLSDILETGVLPVALRRRAWIETDEDGHLMRIREVALRRRAWIETSTASISRLWDRGRPPQEGVD